MFTGLVQSIGRIAASVPTTTGRNLHVELGDLPVAGIKHGDSIAVSGVCLTVVEILDEAIARFDVIPETLQRTTLGNKKARDKVNLEASLRVGDALGGHFVQGHVDAVVTVLHVSADPADWRITFQLPETCRGLVVDKGSVALDGVSMTVAHVVRDRFTAAVIPVTRRDTTLGLLRVGDNVNLETDIFARTILNYLRQMAPAGDIAMVRGGDIP